MKYDDDRRGRNFIKEPQVSSRRYKGLDEPRFYVAQIYLLRKGKLRILVILYTNEFQLRVSRGIDPVVSIHHGETRGFDMSPLSKKESIYCPWRIQEPVKANTRHGGPFEEKREKGNELDARTDRYIETWQDDYYFEQIISS